LVAASRRACETNTAIPHEDRRAVMTELDAAAPGLLGDDRAAAVLGDETRRRVQTFRLPARDERHAARFLRKQ